MPHQNPPDESLRQLLTEAKTVALVGASSNPQRPSHEVMQKLLRVGFQVFPVNPRETEVLGQKAYPSLQDVPGPVDIVDVFRREEETPAIASEAVAIGAKTLWLQLGISNEEAARIASEGGLTVVMNACMGVAVGRLGIAPKGKGGR